MRTVILLVLAIGALWYCFVGGRRLDEDDVREAYARYWKAFDANDGKTICDLYDKKFSAKMKTRTASGMVDDEAGKAQACDSTARFYELKDATEKKSGVELSVNVEYTVGSIDIAADKKSATAHVDSEIRLGTENRLYLKINESQTDTLIRDLGATKFLATEGVVTLR